MSLLILIGLLGMALVLFFRRPIIDMCNQDNKLIQKLKNTSWFQNHWLSGTFLFMMNAVLFFSTVVVLYGLTYINIPYVHLLIMFLAVIGSIFLWIIMNKVWQGTNRNRLKMAAIGSSFYVFLSLLFIYMLVTLQPSYPGEDTFMKGIGILFDLIVVTVAFISCFIFTGFSKKKGT